MDEQNLVLNIFQQFIYHKQNHWNWIEGWKENK